MDQAEAIAAAMGLTAAVSALTEEVKKVKTDEHNTRFWTRVAIWSLVLNTIFTVAIGYVSVNAHTLNQRLAQAQVSSCQDSNKVRADDIRLWTTVISDINLTPTQKVDALEFVNRTFMPTDCKVIQ